MLITKKMLEEVNERLKTDPPITEEQRAKNKALGEKLRNLSPKERKELEKQATEKYGLL